ncbi:YqgE/AlgH family protein [Parabacteroides sp. PF5-9]|uniref:YqgE/AlgH family protein n=1 Tax=Parabacteroides sp. PF5-9 TaxID=1742404 RepID=UPI0024757326|nr:YqgE/AlgH family protein [Parabacteroides sp. PF5-9]MDH6357539.1 putative transcriptional regulator [Parabacteroides sp. PF5-9]
MAYFNNIFRVTDNNLLPTQGNILISEPGLQDMYFQRSVVLLVNHDQDGSMGFVLNKKTDLLVNSFFTELEDLAEMPIFLGGPVCANRLFFIHSLGDLIPDSKKINDHLYFDGDFDILKGYIRNGLAVEDKVKFFLGYSGWTKGQLGKEIEGHSWVVSQAVNDSIIQAEGELYWKNSLKLLGSDYKSWINYPKDPQLN